MAIIKAKVCDVHLSQKKQNVEATETIKISIPGAAFGGTKARSFNVDVCSSCGKEVSKMESKAQTDTEKAWGSMMGLAGTSAEKLRKTPKAQPDAAEEATEDTATEDPAEAAPSAEEPAADQPAPQWSNA